MMHVFLPLLLMVAWLPYGETCGIPDAMRCTSGAVLAEAQSGAVVVSADVLVQPAADGRFWAGLALNGDVAADNLYVQSAVEHGIAPYDALTSEPSAVLLADGADHCCRIFGTIDPAVPHHLSVSYDGKSSATACVDGACERVKIALGTYQVELLCVGVNPGESGSNPVGCSFTNLQITAGNAQHKRR